MSTTDTNNDFVEIGVADEGILINHITGSDEAAKDLIAEFIRRMEELGIRGTVEFSSPCG